MKKLKQSAGLTLLELLASLLVTTLLVAAMGSGMEAALNSYRASQFATNSAALESIVNTTLGDILRHSRNVKISGNDVQFTNEEYGVANGSIRAEEGRLRICDPQGNAMELANSGVYGGLKIEDFEMVYVVPGTEGSRGGYFQIAYTIRSADESQSRESKLVVRLLNSG